MRLSLTTCFLVALLAPGCDADDKCVADCQDQGTTTSDDDGTPTGDTASPSDSGAAVCMEAEDAATAWVQQNRACTYISDCDQLDAICYQGEEVGTCGTVAVSVDADAAQWNSLHGELMACGECGAAACGAWAGCGDDGQCVDLGPGGDICPEVDADITAFVANNRACEIDADCQLTDALCYAGPEVSCGFVALNTGADLETFGRLHDLLDICVEECGGDPCGPSVSCSPQGQCIATFP